MNTCTNCGYQVPPDKSICPNCGERMVISLESDAGKLITGKRWGDLALGFICCWLLIIVWLTGLSLSLGNAIATAVFLFVGTCLMLFVVPALYFSASENRPALARGFGFGLVSVLVVILGAFVVCLRAIDESYQRLLGKP